MGNVERRDKGTVLMRCTKCDVNKAPDAFYTYNRGGTQQHRRDCKDCVNANRKPRSGPSPSKARRLALIELSQRHPEEFEQIKTDILTLLAEPHALVCDVCDEPLAVHRIGQCRA